MSRRWRLGRVFVLRHSGMPFDWLEGLGASRDLLRAADELLDIEESLDLPALPKPVRGAIAACAPERLSAKRTDLREWCDSARRFRALYQEADERATDEMRVVLQRPFVGEAVFLSNPAVYHNMLLPLLNDAGPLNARRRRARRQLYTYLQRFCGKSETVSFFGPIGYGATKAGADAVLRTDLPRTRRVFLAAWAARELARALARDPGLLPDLRFHLTHPDGEQRNAAAEPGSAAATVLAAISRDGQTLRGICRRTNLPARKAAHALRELVAAGVLDVALGAGPYDLDPLGTLGGQLGALPTAPARDLWLQRLRDLDRLRAALETEPFPDKVKTLQELEGLFETYTGVPPRRGAGRTYADRAIVYEECSSNFSLEVGEELLRDWERRLGPILEVCTAHGHATQLHAAHQVAKAISPGPWEMTLASYAHRTTELFQPQGSAFQADHAPRYGGPDDLDRLLRDAATLDGDRYALIDLCPRAEDVAGLPSAGLIAARVHHHLQIPGWLDVMHPDPADFAAEAAAWLAEHGDRLVGFDFGRRNKGYYRFPGREVALRALSWTDADRDDLLHADELTVRVEHDRVRLTGPGEQELLAYLPLSDFAKYPPYAALSHPQVLHPVFVSDSQGQDDEVRVADVVVQRARWHIEAPGATAEARFLAMRRLARRTGRRFVFVRSRQERKPYLIDLESPPAADLLGHVAPAGEPLTAEAMLPGPDELWLRDDQGRRYVCELRIQVIGRDAS